MNLGVLRSAGYDPLGCLQARLCEALTLLGFAERGLQYTTPAAMQLNFSAQARLACMLQRGKALHATGRPEEAAAVLETAASRAAGLQLCVHELRALQAKERMCYEKEYFRTSRAPRTWRSTSRGLARRTRRTARRTTLPKRKWRIRSLSLSATRGTLGAGT